MVPWMSIEHVFFGLFILWNLPFYIHKNKNINGYEHVNIACIKYNEGDNTYSIWECLLVH